MTELPELPHNFEAEQALLGAILMNNAAYHQVADFLRA
jgi:replicative DNA helicase